MYFFVTNKFYLQTSAIELAEIKRQQIFADLGRDSRIVEIEDSFVHPLVEERVGADRHIINMYSYFQGITSISIEEEKQVISQIFTNKTYHKYQVEETDKVNKYNLVCYQAEDNSIKLYLANGRIYYVDYFDHYGFFDRRDFYKEGKRSSSEFYGDDGRILVRQYYDDYEVPILTFYYRGADNNQSALTMIQLKFRGEINSFNDENQLIKYFLEKLVNDNTVNGEQTTFLIDRSVPQLSVLEEWTLPSVKFYFVFHSLFKDKDTVRAAYKPIPALIEKGIINGLIASTNQECEDLAKSFRLNLNQVNSIPVTYTSPVARARFESRDPNKILLVSRISEEKNIMDAIKAVVKIHKLHPKAYLNIWGYNNDDEMLELATNFIRDNNADGYIHFCGFSNTLVHEYDTAAIQLLTSKYEAFAMALLEGQEHGVPGISYDVTYGPRNIIQDGKSGYLVRPGAIADLTNKLDYLLSNDQLRESFSNAAYDNAKRYSRDEISSLWKDFIKNNEEITN